MFNVNSWIDNKGKLFGIINLFDLFILFIIIISIFLTVEWIRTAEDPSWVRVETMYTSWIGIFEVPNYVFEFIKEDDEMLNEDGLTVLRLKKILNNELANPSELNVYYSKTGDKLVIEKDILIINSKDEKQIFYKKHRSPARIEEERRRITAIISILVYKRRNKIYSVISNAPIVVGDRIVMSTKNYKIEINIRKPLRGEIAFPKKRNI